MDPRIETVTKGWRFRSCDPGYAGLNALAEGQFSGSVAAEGATGFMVNGRLVGITGGTIESFWSSDIAALEADEPTEALLCAMLIRDGNVEAEYYTGETPIETVHQTLASGSFIGYLELSENVFSGDYFILYYGGMSKSVALLGTEERVISGEEAFERASDEVGIYDVKSVSIDVIDIPEPEVDDSGGEDAEDAKEESTLDNDPVDDSTSTIDVESDPVGDDPMPGTEDTQASQTAVQRQPPDEEPAEQNLASLAEAARGGSAATVKPGESASTGTDEWLTIPALDPSNTDFKAPEQDDSSSGSETGTSPETEHPGTEEASSSTDESNEELVAELEAAKRENERLRTRVDELQAKLTELESEPGSTDMSARDAIGGTNLFVRYATKGRNTLEDALSSGSDRDAIKQNILLEQHTRFDADEATVGGEAFEAFLESALEHRFVEWMLKDLLFELRDSGQEKGFAGLIDSIPDVDRVEFHGTIPVHTQEGGERRSEQFEFDVVFRDSMGAALMVANVHDDRSPVGEDEVASLLADANTVATARPSLKGALFVTRSFFEPGALETVASATGGGLLRGGSRESYVSVSRKHGFHLCLVEARDSTFHLNVPDA